MKLTIHNIAKEFCNVFPDAQTSVADDDGMDPASRVDWIFRHEVIPAALIEPSALPLVFGWVERLLESDDDVVTYWRDVRLFEKTLVGPEWEPLVERYGGPLLRRRWS